MLVADRGAVTLHRARLGEPRQPRDRRRRHPDRRLRRSRRPARGRVHGLVARPAERAVREHARGRRARPADQAERGLAGRGRARAGNAGRRSRVPTAPRSSTSRSSRPAAHRGLCRCTSTSTAARTRRGRLGGGSPCISRSPPPAIAVVLPNPRGSTSYGQAFSSACVGDWGGGDLEDILACCDDLIERGVADGGRMFVSGGSYGGFMTSWIVGHSDRFRAATALAAVVDQTSMALTTEIPDFSVFNMGGTPWERAERVRETLAAHLPAGGDDAGARRPLGGRPPRADRAGRGAVHGPASARQASRARPLSGWVPRPAHALAGASTMARRILAWDQQHDVRPRKRARPR